MTSSHSNPSSVQQPFANPQPAPVPSTSQAVSQATSPPTKQSLKSWWKGFRPPAKSNETHGKFPSYRCQSSSASRQYSLSDQSMSRLPKARASFFRESIMNDTAPVIDGLPVEEASQASLSQQKSQRRLSFPAFNTRNLLRSSSGRHSSSNLREGSNQEQLRQKRSSIIADAKQRFSAIEEERFDQSSTSIADHDSDPNAPLRAGILSTPKRRSLCYICNNIFSSRFSEESAKQTMKTADHPTGIFGVPLRESIGYANVAISLVDAEGKSYIYGYVPIVVAKCGVYLKEKATNVEGIFRLSGSEKRIKELKTIFDSPERYGKGLDWAGYTVHDAANVLRRYLNLLPEPIVPLDLYERFRDPLRGHIKQPVNDNEGPQLDDDFDVDKAIATYQQLITELPPLNRQLLLYILDLLAVFASKSDENRMNSQNLAAIFQPGMLSHPQHDMSPLEYRLSQDVLIFLIENQDHFLIGMRGTAADEKTVQEVQSGGTPPSNTPITPGKPRFGLGRSASNASVSGDSTRRFSGLRRNVSVSSRQSRQSNGAPSPATPTYAGSLPMGTSGGVHRSNTVPSKKSPGMPQGRMHKSSGSPSPVGARVSSQSLAPRDPSPLAPASERGVSPSPGVAPPTVGISSLAPSSHAGSTVTSQERLLGDQPEKQPEVVTPSKERNVASFFQRSPTVDSDKRPPNKLRKKRMLSSNPSAQSSTNSLHAPRSNSISPGPRPTRDRQDVMEHPPLDTIRSASPVPSITDAPPVATDTPRAEPSQPLPTKPEDPHQSLDHTLKKGKASPVSSLRSRSSFEQSDLDHIDDSTAAVEQREKRSRWRLSRRREDFHGHTLSPHKALGSDNGAGTSTSSVGSSARQRKSFTIDSRPTDPESTLGQSSNEGGGPAGEEKRGPLGWIKSKMREKREEKEAEKERTKSPPASTDHLASRGKSMDLRREENPERLNPERLTEAQPLGQTEPSKQ